MKLSNIDIPLTANSKIPQIDRFVMRYRQLMDMLFLPFEYFYDMRCFARNCRISPFIPGTARKGYDLIFFSHTIEKGLSMANPRPLFGKKNIARMVHLLRITDNENFDQMAVDMALGCLNSYLDLHQRINVSDPFLEELKEEYHRFANKFGLKGDGGAKNVEDVRRKLQNNAYNYQDFLRTRYSCRAFEPTPLPQDTITEVVNIAQNAPSQCNRQASKVHCFQDKTMIRKLLLLQRGCRTFIDEISTLLVITNDLICWDYRSGRNAGFVDAGMFAMSLLYACHAKGIGGCPLSFAKNGSVERQFKYIAKIPRNERVVILLAVGFPASQSVLAARSKRRQVDTILRFDA